MYWPWSIGRLVLQIQTSPDSLDIASDVAIDNITE